MTGQRLMRIGSGFGVAACCACLAGCFGPSGGKASLSVESRSQQTILTPAFKTAVFTSNDLNSVDIFLSDLPPESFDPAGSSVAPAGGREGVIIHMNFFLYPRAGRTPVAFTATNMTFSMVVLTGDSHGVYGGGGFFLPSGKPTGKTFGGRTNLATLRHLGSTAGFVDRVGLGEMSGSITARRDEELADRMATLMTGLVRIQTASSER